MTAETSNAREWVLERLRGVLEHGKMGDKCLIAPDLVTAAIASLSAPPPAAARVDVRGFVALAEQMERDAAECRRDGYTDAAVVKEDCAQRIRQTLGISAIAEALAAEGVQPDPKPEARGVADAKPVGTITRRDSGDEVIEHRIALDPGFEESLYRYPAGTVIHLYAEAAADVALAHVQAAAAALAETRNVR